MGEEFNEYYAGITICANCRFMLKPSGAEYTPHPESICTVEWAFNFVTGEKYHPLCKDGNKSGNCFFFKRKEE